MTFPQFTVLAGSVQLDVVGPLAMVWESIAVRDMASEKKQKETMPKTARFPWGAMGTPATGGAVTHKSEGFPHQTKGQSRSLLVRG